MLFSSLHDRLISHLRDKVRAGELTERGLARLTGMSQPHVHNVLKGVRSLSTTYADQVLSHLHLSVFDLFTAQEMGIIDAGFTRSGLVQVPQLRGLAGPLDVLQEQPSPGDFYPIAESIAANVIAPVVVALGHDPLLVPHFQAGDIALATRSMRSRVTLEATAVYLVKADAATLVRSVRSGGTRLYLITPGTQNEPRKWDSLPLRGQDLGEVIVGKVVWIARKLTEYSFLLPPSTS